MKKRINTNISLTGKINHIQIYYNKNKYGLLFSNNKLFLKNKYNIININKNFIFLNY
jgi:hypothetical protein